MHPTHAARVATAPVSELMAVPVRELVRPRSIEEALVWLAPGREPTHAERELAAAVAAGDVVLVRRPLRASMPPLPEAEIPRLSDLAAAPRVRPRSERAP